VTRNWRITFRINTTEGEIEVSRYIVKKTENSARRGSATLAAHQGLQPIDQFQGVLGRQGVGKDLGQGLFQG
jgi:hypothetical protein